MAIVECLEPTHMDGIQNVTNTNLTAVNSSTFAIESDIQTTFTANGTFNNQQGGVNYAGLITEIALDTVDYGLFPNFFITTAFNMTSATWLQLRDGQFATVIQLVLDGADTFYGSRGDDVLRGFGGDDVFMTSAGADLFDGGAGTNTVNYSTAGPGLVVELETPGFNAGAAAGDTYINVNNVVGSNYADFLYGNIFMNRLSGGAGNDTLVGKSGDDTLDGGAGTDTASYDASAFGVIASLLNPSINTGHANLDIYISIENIAGGSFNDTLYGDDLANTVSGNAYPNVVILDNDILYGMGGNDMLFGYSGNDTLTGGLGQDTLVGGLGNDIYVLENGSDTVVDSGGLDTATSTISRALAVGGLTAIENLVLVNVATALNVSGNALNNVLSGNTFANQLDGGTGNDTLFGAVGNDTLLGGFGDDILVGGADRDTLNGGANNDIFRFLTTADSTVANPDIISDFADNGDDRIDVSALFGPALIFRGPAPFNAAGQLRINDIVGPDLLVEVNTGGSLAADFAIRLTNTAVGSMTATDFIL